MQSINLKAYAKINLGLDVIKRRENGYHDVRMIMQTINLYDKIAIRKTRNFGIHVNTNLYYLPTNEDNLVYKAANLLMKEFHILDGLVIDLKKYIPVAAGMAGGSSDAASVLFGVNRMFHLGLSVEELMKRASTLGADIPYCLLRGTALAEGIGDILTPLPPMPQCSVLIAKPAIGVSTKFVYENLKADKLLWHPDIDGIKEAIMQKDLAGVSKRLGNVLETVTIPEYPVIGQIKQFFINQGAMNALMSGSGPTVFGLFDNHAKAKRAFLMLKKMPFAKQSYMTEFFNRS